MITAGLAHERATRSIHKDVYDKLEKAVDEAAAKGCLYTHVNLTEDECSDALVDELRCTYNYKVYVHYLDAIDEGGSIRIDMKLEW